MCSVYTRRPAVGDGFLLRTFARASALHIGAAAAAAALRDDLVDGGHVDRAAFDESYAAARLTPGTNLLALYTALGYELSGWRGAVLALAAGTLVPGAIVIAITAAYVEHVSNAFVALAMRGARAGALAVLLWAVVRLIRPVLVEQPARGGALAVGVLVLSFTGVLAPLWIVLLAGAFGAAGFRQGPPRV
jgi:chromate transport protein ChrA